MNTRCRHALVALAAVVCRDTWLCFRGRCCRSSQAARHNHQSDQSACRARCADSSQGGCHHRPGRAGGCKLHYAGPDGGRLCAAPTKSVSPATAATASSSAPASGAAAPVAPDVIRVPYVPEVVKQEITDQVKQDVLAQAKTERWGEPGAFPDWLQHINFFGDVRFRAQADRYPVDGTPNAPPAVLQFFGVNVNNSTTPENLLRFRARLGLEATPVAPVTIGIRLASGGVGSGGNPDSENQTLGNYNSRETVGFDRAYIAYRPLSWTTITSVVSAIRFSTRRVSCGRTI